MVELAIMILPLFVPALAKLFRSAVPAPEPVGVSKARLFVLGLLAYVLFILFTVAAVKLCVRVLP